MLDKMLEARLIPDLFSLNNGARVLTPADWTERRRELTDLLGEQLFGHTPAAPDHVDCEILKTDSDALGGKAVRQHMTLSFPTPKGSFAFPVEFVYPKSSEPSPLFVSINFPAELAVDHQPIEEMIDRGYAVANFNYRDITSDTAEEDGLMTHYPSGEANSWGKIGMWAFAASRVLDYALTRPEIDPARTAVIGHSRLGKTALWCGAQDERFSMVVSNDSGCSGAAISRGKVGETIELISSPSRFHYWFCKNYRAWADHEYEAPFDQHMLLALVAPRKLYVASAAEDEWADPVSEFLGAYAVNPVYSLLGETGLVTPDALPAAGDALHEGAIGCHLRPGTHFLGRTDWNLYMDYRDKHGV